MLYQKGYERRAVIDLLRFIDWVMVLPAELSEEVEEELRAFEEEQKMPYVTSWEKKATEKGLEQGIPKGESRLLRLQLARRYGALPRWIDERLDKATTEELERWGERFVDATSPEEVFGDS